jgi:hypothetical protein
MYVTGSVKGMKRAIGDFMADEVKRYRHKAEVDEENEEIEDTEDDG